MNQKQKRPITFKAACQNQAYTEQNIAPDSAILEL